MKKIMNQVEHVVDEMCAGLAAAYPQKLLHESRYRLIYRKELRRDKVMLISGGGSGHEPAHAGYVGKGMLDLAVCGDVFASPSSIQVYHGILKANSAQGSLLIIKNYSGDKMNFEVAAEMATEDGLLVDTVFVNDDVAVQDSLYTIGRRGVAGAVFVHKIAGAAAEAGLPLEEVKRLAEKCAGQVRSLGFALTSCTVPAKGSPTFALEEDKIEFGVGIHGEPGIQRQDMLRSKQLAEQALDKILADLDFSGSEVAVMINGFGGTPTMELFILFHDVFDYLNKKQIKIERSFVGNFMTSIDMAGASITVLKLDDELKPYLDAPVDVLGFNMFG